MEQKIKKGDVVELKSGGPDMTVDYCGENLSDCSWFVEGQLKQASFQISSLKLSENQ